MAKMQPAVTELSFTIPAGADDRSYIDTANELSKVNRRLYSQSRMYGFQGLTFIWRADAAAAVATIEVSVGTAGNSWIVQNAHVKGEALWNQMQALVLDDNPSIRGKWHDFKVLLSSQHTQARTLLSVDSGGIPYLAGEWNPSTYVMPQHEVDPITGLPLVADEFTATLIGDDTSSKRSLVLAYQQSRATVFPDAPNVPAGMSGSFFNLLTDSGSQEPELADVIETENDYPPYDIDVYPGNGTNGLNPVTVQYGAISASEVDGRLGGFVAPCGLLEIKLVGFDAAGAVIAPALMPAVDILLHVAPGPYKGVASIPMGQ